MNEENRKTYRDMYKNRVPEMGIISLECIATGEKFLGASKDIKADFNSTEFKLSSGNFPNRHLLELWKKYGRDGFQFSVLTKLVFEDVDNDKEPNDGKVKVVKCKDHTEDQTELLEGLREKYLEGDEKAFKIWK